MIFSLKYIMLFVFFRSPSHTVQIIDRRDVSSSMILLYLFLNRYVILRTDNLFPIQNFWQLLACAPEQCPGSVNNRPIRCLGRRNHMEPHYLRHRQTHLLRHPQQRPPRPLQAIQTAFFIQPLLPDPFHPYRPAKRATTRPGWPQLQRHLEKRPESAPDQVFQQSQSNQGGFNMTFDDDSCQNGIGRIQFYLK